MTTSSSSILPGLPVLPRYRETFAFLQGAEGFREHRQQHQYRAPGFHEDWTPSVTTVLGRFKDSAPLVSWMRREMLDRVRRTLQEANPYVPQVNPETGRYLESWIEDLLAEANREPERQRDEAAEAGTLAHAAVEAHLNGQTPTVPEHLQPALQGAIQFIRDYRLTPIATEVRVFHPHYPILGTVDLVACDPQGQLVVADWKRSKRFQSEMAYQVAAYSMAIAALCGDAPRRGYVVRLAREADEAASYEARAVNWVYLAETVRQMVTLYRRLKRPVWSED